MPEQHCHYPLVPFWSAARLTAQPGPDLVEAYAFVTETRSVYQWDLGSTATVDGVAVLTHNGGTAGRWLFVCSFPETADASAIDPEIWLTRDNYDASTGTWTNLGTAGNATQSNAARRPSLTATGVLFDGVDDLLDGTLVASEHIPASMWIVVSGANSSQLGTLFCTRETATADANAVRNLEVLKGSSSLYVQAYDRLTASQGAADRPGSGVEIYEIRWTATERRITDGNGEWYGTDIAEYLSASPRPLAGYRIGSRFAGNPFLLADCEIRELIFKLGALSDVERECVNRYLFETHGLSEPYRWTAADPVYTAISAPTSTTKRLASITNSGWASGFALRRAQDRLSPYLITVGGSTPTAGGGTVKNDGQGGKTWANFATQGTAGGDGWRSPLVTPGTSTINVPQWLATLSAPPDIILWSLGEGEALNALAGATLTSNITASLVHAENLLAAVDAQLPSVQHIISTPFNGNGRPVGVEGSPWGIHADRASWVAARDQVVDAYEDQFSGRARITVMPFHTWLDPVSSWHVREGYTGATPAPTPGLHTNYWHGELWQGELLAAFLKETYW